MLLSSRANPPKPLNVPISHHLSIKQLLLHSPLPSPSLPSILPRHGKKPPPLDSRKILRILCGLAFCVTLYWMYSLTTTTTASTLVTLVNLPYLSWSGKSYEIVTGSELPEYPTAIGVTDKKGKQKWTISIPGILGFPIPATDYAEICSHVEEVSRHAAGQSQNIGGEGTQGYYAQDSRYVDIAKAQADNLLPKDHSMEGKSEQHSQCKTTMTYVLDASDAGLGSTLLSLWLAYGLAKHEGRSFFIDDTHFPYGNYSTFFISPISPKCHPPPSTQRVPCPHQASHLVVSAATSHWTFGEAFHRHFSKKDIFEMARTGYEALFKLRLDDANYVAQRIEKLQPDDKTNGNPVIGMHIRRGDRHPFEFAYQHGYLPVNQYTSSMKHIKADHKQIQATASTKTKHKKKVLLASDDPDIYDHLELKDLTIRAQDKIVLASKKSLSKGSLGWEGGFFKDLFWDLGLPYELQQQKKRLGSPMPNKKKMQSEKEQSPSSSSSDPTKENHRQQQHQSNDDRDYKTNPTKEALQLREFIGRAYLLELSILAKTDRVICAVSSYTCRVLAVMLGWDRAFVQNHWVNVDGKYPWRAVDYN